MMRALLIRGMLVGILAGVLAFGVARIFGEPEVDRAIAFEEQMDAAKAVAEKSANKSPTTNMTMSGGHDMSDAQAAEPELVTRTTQAGIGLLTEVVVYGAAFGGLFAVAFGLVLGRLSRFGPRPTAALLAAAAFTTVYLVPSLKYPANPPSVGLPETIGYRTSLFVAMIAISIAAMIVAIKLAQWFAEQYGNWTATLLGAAVFFAIVVIAQLALPPLNEVPEGFPADVLWNFRIASIGIQVMMWSTLGIVFGYFAEKLLLARSRSPV